MSFYIRSYLDKYVKKKLDPTNVIFYISNFIFLIRDNCLIAGRNYREVKLIHQLVVNIIWVLKIKYILNINYENFKK